jgi:mono/diheme cytochrome c family protein
MNGKIALAAAIAVTLSAGMATAAQKTIELPEETAALKKSDNPGYKVAVENCVACHSADYISYQPPKKGAAFWDAEVQKMIKTFHAPVSEDDAKAIAGYLAATY